MPEQPPVIDENREEIGPALLGYVLLLASLVLMITGIVAVVIAYIYRDEAPTWLQSHYQLQIRTFWLSIIPLVVVALTWWVLIGQLVLLLWLVWFLVRCIKGIRYLNLRRPYPKPESWWI